jgi:hypothetical protein
MVTDNFNLSKDEYEALGRAFARGLSISAMLEAEMVKNVESLSFMEFLNLCEKIKQDNWLKDQEAIEQKRIVMLNPSSPEEHHIEIIKLLSLGQSANSIAKKLNIKPQLLTTKISNWGYRHLNNKWIHESDPLWQIHLMEEDRKDEKEEEFEKHITELTDFIRENADTFITLGILLQKIE